MNEPQKPLKWNELSEELKLGFTVNNSIQVVDWYIDNSTPDNRHYTDEDIKKFHSMAKQRIQDDECYGITDKWLYEALDLCEIQNQTVAVMGSIRPWYEVIALEFGNFPTVIDYNLPNYEHPQIKKMLLPELIKSDLKFDVGFSISSFEHDGLGRYGDPINPNGDMRAMAEMKTMLKKDGLLFLSVPCGKDKIVWNAHRIYGNIRLKMLFQGWEVIGAVGYHEDNLNVDTGVSAQYQPIFVLKNN